jgi:hypothetical protein
MLGFLRQPNLHDRQSMSAISPKIRVIRVGWVEPQAKPNTHDRQSMSAISPKIRTIRVAWVEPQAKPNTPRITL